MSAPNAPASPFVLGIDPGMVTGLAAYVPAENALAFVTSAGPLQALRLLTAWHREGALAAAVIEDSRPLPVYARHRNVNRGERDRIARSVGRVDVLTELYAELLRSLDVPVRTREPVRSAKWTAADLARITGYASRTNEHGRDAARLVFGCRIPKPPAHRPAPPRASRGRNVSADTSAPPSPEPGPPPVRFRHEE